MNYSEKLIVEIKGQIISAVINLILESAEWLYYLFPVSKGILHLIDTWKQTELFIIDILLLYRRKQIIVLFNQGGCIKSMDVD